MRAKWIIFIFLFIVSIFALGLTLVLLSGVSDTYYFYDHMEVGLQIIGLVNPIIPSALLTAHNNAENYILRSGYVLIGIVFLYLVRSFYLNFRDSKPYNYIPFVALIVCMISIPLVFDLSFYLFGFTRCGNILFRCEQIWHTEENSLGHPVDIYYIYDPKGVVVYPNVKGCSYRGTLENYIEIVELIPKSGKTIAGETTHYFFNDGSSLTVDMVHEPKRQEGNLSLAMREAMNKIMYKGTSCEDVY
jgi:hypothetical protein